MKLMPEQEHYYRKGYTNGFKDGRVDGARIAASAYVTALNPAPIIVPVTPETQRLIELGKAVERVLYEFGYFEAANLVELDDDTDEMESEAWESADELLDWYRKEADANG